MVINPYKPNVLFVGHRETVQIQIRRHRTHRLIRVSTVCAQNVVLKFQTKRNIPPTILKTEMECSIGEEWETPFGLNGLITISWAVVRSEVVSLPGHTHVPSNDAEVAQYICTHVVTSELKIGLGTTGQGLLDSVSPSVCQSVILSLMSGLCLLQGQAKFIIPPQDYYP